jgi:hypothetical protein
MNLKITDRSKAEFEFYLTTTLDMIGRAVSGEMKAVADGYSALECWWAKDTHGKTLPCREPELLEKVFRSKKSINLQVKLWAEDLADGMLLQQSELRGYLVGWPAWVWTATIGQARKIAIQKVGFVPTFLQT